MKTNHEEIDEMIRQALSREDARFYDELGEQTLPEMVGGLFKGKMKWITILTMVIMPVLFGIGVYCAFRFYQANEIREMLIWAASGYFFILGTVFLKLFHWMQMDKNTILREIKRMELQVALLNGKLEKK